MRLASALVSQEALEALEASVQALRAYAREMPIYLPVDGRPAAFLATLSASSFPGMPRWPGTQHIKTSLPEAWSSPARRCAGRTRACPGPGLVCCYLLIAFWASRYTLMGPGGPSASAHSRASATPTNSASNTSNSAPRGAKRAFQGLPGGL